MAKPGAQLQASLYNGKDKVHAIKHTALNGPDGMIMIMAGPQCGRTHDQLMFNRSNINGALREVQNDLLIEARDHLNAYADKGYTTTTHMTAAHKVRVNHPLTEDQVLDNNHMKSIRGVGAQFPFGKISTTRCYIDYKIGLKTQLSAVGKYYIAAALLVNASTCLYGNKGITSYFNIDPPTLEEYTHFDP